MRHQASMKGKYCPRMERPSLQKCIGACSVIPHTTAGQSFWLATQATGRGSSPCYAKSQPQGLLEENVTCWLPKDICFYPFPTIPHPLGLLHCPTVTWGRLPKNGAPVGMFSQPQCTGSLLLSIAFSSMVDGVQQLLNIALTCTVLSFVKYLQKQKKNVTFFISRNN